MKTFMGLYKEFLNAWAEDIKKSRYDHDRDKILMNIIASGRIDDQLMALLKACDPILWKAIKIIVDTNSQPCNKERKGKKYE